MILIISNKTDLATDYLVHYLSEKKIKYVRLNTEDFQLKWEVNFDISSKGSEVIIHRYSDNYKLSTTMIYGAYIRQPQLPDLNLSNSDKEFGMREVGETLKSLWRVIPEKIWLNAPHNILRASNKPEQLQIAKSVGFNIPNTCITSNIEKIYSFYQSNNQQIIAKAVKHGFQYDGYKAKVVATQKLNSKQLSTIKNFAKVPMIFQEFIEKTVTYG
ncbi:hypothetical protein B5G52_12285 [Pseudoalteromonas sp. A601]|uniref:MvdC/MvdD family ATP grasp protein n=1 Tax=Pseudoalteromonas sp. A601 TaxID=1967839 RepID=UPI000B3C8AAB|nr:hypothetical protein [Pseudoalteromonas sp. A601]OUS71305.1 hypothetical protein B5G52_12285 [Pseudoalteromonas sp. A601]